MPHLNSFIPAYHYALSKVRCNPPVNLSAGVEQQALEYLSSLNGSKQVQQVRPFPASRQRFQVEGYVKSYIYSPDRYTIPVEKAKNLVEMFRRVPESSSAPGAAEAAEARDDAQINPIKEAKQKKVAVDTNRLKRKVKDEARSARAKSSRMATPSNGEAEEGQGRVMMKLI